MGNLRSGFNAVLLFGLMIACLHLYTLRQRMHQLEEKMTIVKDGHSVVRRSLATEEEPENALGSNVPVEGLELEEGSVDKTLGKPQNLQDPFVDKNLGEPQGLDNIPLVKIDLAKNTTQAPTTTSIKAPTKVANTTTTAVQKPIVSIPSLRATSAPSDPIINPHNFSFILNNPDKCGDGDVLLLILVTTTVQGTIQRETIRRTWGNESNIPGVVIKLVFAIGQTDDWAAQAALVEENSKFKDIIQEDFVDSYHNLTLKTVMCLKWAFQYCPKARFIMKADDDTFVNIFSITRHLIGLHKYHAKRYVTGWVYVDTKPIRDPTSQWNKWYVKYEDYPRDSYPKYPCGFAYIISNDITQLLYETSLTIKYLFLEDAFLGLCMEKLGFEPVHHGGFLPWYTHIDSCQFDWLMASHWVKSYEYMWYLWNTLTSC
ncbi:beta-1,3-galactosyltransferase 1-like [Branchiostoma lanceolatum]|uniref:beta-1,3-galactosyltransferase 1-like n=1 Tax=Branchiostoma lanceolatum TaxID=7740 RepID=UPI0034549056